VDDRREPKLGHRTRGLDHEPLPSLTSLIAEARVRTVGLQARAAEHSGDALWTAEALQELDIAHEELRVAEEELHNHATGLLAMQSALDLERQRYRELFHEAPEPYLTTDAHGVVVEANRRASEVLGVPSASLVGKPLAVFVCESDRRTFRDALGDAVARDTVGRIELDITSPLAAAPLRVTASLSRAHGDATSAQLRWILCARDDESLRSRYAVAPTLASSPSMAEQHAHAEDEQRDHLERSERLRTATGNALSRREDSLAIVTHELRNPLSAIKGWLELLADRESVGRLRERALVVLTRNVQTMSRMLEQLVDNSRQNVELLSVDLCEVDLVEVISRSIESSQAAASLASIQLVARLEPHLLGVQGDAMRLEQVLLNLIGNALKFTPEGGTVEVSARAREQFVDIAVRDNGCGIEEQHLRRIFEPFVRLASRGPRASGLGLGLSIARHLIEQHGGELSVQSAGVDKGTTFRIHLPRSDSRAAH